MTSPSTRPRADDIDGEPRRPREERGTSRRRPWIGGAFAVVAIVLIGQKCMCPDPAATLREQITGSAEVRGSPLRSPAPAPLPPVAAPADPVPSTPSSVAATVSPPAVTTPAPVAAPPAAPTASAAIQPAVPPTAKKAEKPAADPKKPKTVTWDDLSRFTYIPPVPEDARSAVEDPSSPSSDRIPESIREMSGTRIAIDGYIVPLDYDHGRVARFILLSAPLACCFAEAPPLNRWILVSNDAKSDLDYTKYDVVRVSGVFDVGEETREGYVVCIYRMRSEKIDAVKQ